jgi:hypothetical protein
MKIEEIKVGNYEFLRTETFVLSNARDVSFYITDNTPQRLKFSIRLSNNPEEQSSIRTDKDDNHHLRLVIKVLPGEKMVSKEFAMIGTYDDDSKPLYMSFYASALNEVSRVLVLNFYTLKHGEDIG